MKRETASAALSKAGNRPVTFSDLSVRRSNCLRRLNLRRKEDIRTAVKNRTLHPSNVNALGFGNKCLAEVRDWLDMPPEITGKQIRTWRAQFALQLRNATFSWREIARVMRFRGPGEAIEHVAHAKRQLGQPFSL